MFTTNHYKHNMVILGLFSWTSLNQRFLLTWIFVAPREDTSRDVPAVSEGPPGARFCVSGELTGGETNWQYVKTLYPCIDPYPNGVWSTNQPQNNHRTWRVKKWQPKMCWNGQIDHEITSISQLPGGHASAVPLWLGFVGNRLSCWPWQWPSKDPWSIEIINDNLIQIYHKP